jgi:hypothetical protein
MVLTAKNPKRVNMFKRLLSKLDNYQNPSKMSNPKATPRNGEVRSAASGGLAHELTPSQQSSEATARRHWK